MKNKKVLALALAATLTMAPTTALAEEWQGPNGNGVDGNTVHEDDKAEYGHTTFSIIQAKQDPNNVSFEVPLYVTMAVVDDEVDVIVPDNYYIANTSGKLVSEGGVNELATVEDGYDIAVVGMDFTKLENSTYNTVVDADASNSSAEMELIIGGVTMPALSDAGTEAANVKADGSVFYKNSEYTAIRVSGDSSVLELPIEATLGTSATYTNTGAAAQFKVTYTVGALDGNGNLMGSVYAGDDKVQAGLDK